MNHKRNIPILALLLAFNAACSKEFKPLFEKGLAAYQQENDVQAVDTINFALPLWKESDGIRSKAQAYETLGLAYQRLRKWDQATAAYIEAIHLSSCAFPSAFNLAEFYFREGKWDSAAQTYKRALVMKRDDPLTLLGLGNALFEKGQYQEAIYSYQRIIDTSPGVRLATEHIKIAAAKLKKKPSAKKKPSPPVKKKSKR